MPEEMEDVLERFAPAERPRGAALRDVNPGLDVPFLVRMEKANREENERQVWAHTAVFCGKTEEIRAEARNIHDWDLCPRCDRIDGGSRHGDGAHFTLPPLPGSTGRDMYQRRADERTERLAKKKARRKERKAAGRPT